MAQRNDSNRHPEGKEHNKELLKRTKGFKVIYHT